MAQAELTIDLAAIVANWRSLDAMSAGETAACVKADAYGLGAEVVGPALAKAGCRTFFVALAEEGATLRKVLGAGPRICVFGGHMEGDAPLMAEHNLIPMLNSPEQVLRHGAGAYGVQLDSGMNRLGMEPSEWASVRDGLTPEFVMSHLACADEASHIMNKQQLAAFTEMTEGVTVPRSLAATGGVLLGADYHFDLTRPGIGLYGGAPYSAAKHVVTLSLPVIQVRDVAKGETVGYGNIWKAERASRIATVSGGYADGLIRAVGRASSLFHGNKACPLVGRVSMDLITVDVTDLTETPTSLDILNGTQTVDTLATAAGTIGYEILTSLGARYARRYVS
ncbi:MAG: alanine racemase [Rhodobacteraceae bacterium]|nr:alanine racemase [Paracoccaceae bacterium]